LFKKESPGHLPEIMIIGEDFTPIPDRLPEIIMDHREIIKEENPVADQFYTALEKLYYQHDCRFHQQNSISLDRYSTCPLEKEKWQTAYKILGDRPDKFPFIKLEHKFTTPSVQITPWVNFPGGKKVELYTIDLKLLRDILDKGKARALKDKQTAEKDVMQKTLDKAREKKLQKITEDFGPNLNIIPGLVDYLLRTCHPDANIFVKTYPEHQLAIVIKEHQWWGKGRGGTGKAAIVGVYQNGKYSCRSFQFRDQFSSSLDDYSLWFDRAELIEFNSTEVILKCYQRVTEYQPTTITIALTEANEAEEKKKLSQQVICTCGNPFGVCICN